MPRPRAPGGDARRGERSSTPSGRAARAAGAAGGARRGRPAPSRRCPASEHVDQHRDLDGVAGRERDRARAASRRAGELARERLPEAGELGIEGAQQRRAPSARSRGRRPQHVRVLADERPPVGALHELDLRRRSTSGPASPLTKWPAEVASCRASSEDDDVAAAATRRARATSRRPCRAPARTRACSSASLERPAPPARDAISRRAVAPSRRPRTSTCAGAPAQCDSSTIGPIVCRALARRDEAPTDTAAPTIEVARSSEWSYGCAVRAALYRRRAMAKTARRRRPGATSSTRGAPTSGSVARGPLRRAPGAARAACRTTSIPRCSRRSERTRRRRALVAPGRGARGGMARPDDRHDRHRQREVAGVQPAGARHARARPARARALPLPDEGARAGPGAQAARAAARRSCATRSTTATRRARSAARSGSARTWSSRTRTCCTSASCPTTRNWGDVLANLALRRRRRGARLPRRVRLARGERAAAAAPAGRGLRHRAALRADERDDRQPGRAGRAADRASSSTLVDDDGAPARRAPGRDVEPAAARRDDGHARARRCREAAELLADLVAGGRADDLLPASRAAASS